MLNDHDSQEFGIALLIEIIDSIKENQNFSDEEPIEYEINPNNYFLISILYFNKKNISKR